MDCSLARANLPAFRGGELSGAEAADVERHLGSCAACAAEERELRSTLGLFASLPEIEASDGVWNRIERRLDRRILPIRPLLRAAVAASLLVAGLSFVILALAARPAPAATVAFVAPDTQEIVPGQRVMTGETFAAPTYVILTLPDVGLLKLNRDAELSFKSPTHVELKRGELFAEVRRGFIVESDDATIAVRGTRFGVRADERPSTIYVVEGVVEVRSGRGTMDVNAGRMATVGGGIAPLREEELAWIAPFEQVLLTIDPLREPFAPGEGGLWRIAFRTTSPAVLELEPIRELPSCLNLKIRNPDRKEYVVRLDGVRLERVEAGTAPNGTVRLDVMTPCVLTCRAESGLFPGPGRYTVALVYQGRQGVLESSPVSIEVR